MADPETFTKAHHQDYYKRLDIYTAGIDGRRVIIEYLKPKKVISNFRIILFQVNYIFAGNLHRKSAINASISN